jgi:hypothetical protein
MQYSESVFIYFMQQFAGVNVLQLHLVEIKREILH